MNPLTEKAIRQGELVKYLAGYPEYEFRDDMSEIPTNPQRSFSELVE